MAMELFLGSLAVLTLAAIVIIAMTTTKRVDYPGDKSRQTRQNGENGSADSDRR